MKRFFLIRHGQSLANVRYITDSTPYIFDGDIPLTEKGTEEASATANFLKTYCKENKLDLKKAILWVSPFLRTEETAKIINEKLKITKLYQDPRLTEMDFGLFDQKALLDCEKIDKQLFNNLQFRNASVRGKFYARRPNGESPADVYTRISTFIETVYRDKTIENVFIISHGITLRALIMRLMHYNLEWYFNEKNAGNCSVRLIEGTPLTDKGYIHGTAINQTIVITK